MHNILFANEAFSTLAANITSAATSVSVQVGHGARFPVLALGQIFRCIMVDSSNNYEFVKATSRANDLFTIVRGEEGTSGRAFTSGDKIRLVFSNQGLLDLIADPQPATVSFVEQGSDPATPASGEFPVYAKAAGTTTGLYGKDAGAAIVPLSRIMQILSDAALTLDENAERYVAMTPTVSRNLTLPTTRIKIGRPIGIFNLGSGQNIVVKSSDGTTLFTIPGGGSVDIIALQDTPTGSTHWKVLSTYLPDAPTIGDLSNMVHDHADAAGGGNILTTPILISPKIRDSGGDHYYVITLNNLEADRNISLPLLLANDTFVFANHAEILASKTLLLPTIADLSNMNHTHAGAGATGGAVAMAVITGVINNTQHGDRGGGALHADVVAAGADGFMTGADKTKLDGIETAATADQTKADIDALNIDADTLDGNDWTAPGAIGGSTPGAGTFTAVKTANAFFLQKVIPIGNWDMFAFGIHVVDHNLAGGWTKIRSVTGVIQNDAGTIYYPVGQDVAGILHVGVTSINSTNVSLNRTSTGFFSDATFRTPPSLNRGWLIIIYEQ